VSVSSVVDLGWQVTEPADIGRERGHVAAVFNLPEGRPGYVDVWSVRPQAPQSARRGNPYTVVSERADIAGRRVKLGRWTEDAASAAIFRLARAALPYEVRRPQAVWWGVDRMLSSSGQRLVFFDATGKSYLDRAAILAARAVAQGDFAAAVEASTSTDEIVSLPPQEDDNKGGNNKGNNKSSDDGAPVEARRRWPWVVLAAAVVVAVGGTLALRGMR
jgi:hypothetical protein